VRVDLGGMDLELVGWILAVVGVIGLIASLLLARQSRPVVRREAEYPPRHPPDPRYQAATSSASLGRRPGVGVEV
jgi:hypothetical protein